jgi:PAS domain S-box-containing protein
VLTLAEYRIIVEQAPIMIWRADVMARCDYFNVRWLAFTGRTLEEELGEGWAMGVHAEDRERCLRMFHEAFARREVFEIEYRLRRYDGEYRWVLDAGAPIHDPDGRFVGFAGSCVDVTERVEARATLARATLKDLGLAN